jgi:hypothetical protein
MRCRPLLLLALLTAAIPLGLGLWADAADAQPARRITREARLQMESLRAEKRARTPRQRKLSSRLLHADKMRRGVAITSRVRTLRTGVQIDADGSTLVDIRADVVPRVLNRIAQLGGRVVVAVPEHDAIRARMPVAQLETLAGLPTVRSIRPADRAFTRKIDTSEGDVAHRADLVRSTYGIDGAGIGIGVLSDGVDTLAARQASGDLPPVVTVLAGQAGTGDEGTAILEIIFDLAPGADLFFATAFNGQAQFAANIIALQAAGADVIIDDVGYFAESVFQDDTIADAVDTVVAAGAMFFSSAGNFGNLNDGTSSVYEGNFNFTGTLFGPQQAHDFDGLGDTMNLITADTPFVFTLHWSDPNGASANDHDLFLLNGPGTMVIASSTDVQDGDDDPIEGIDSDMFDDTGNNLVVARDVGAADRFFHLNSNSGRMEFDTDGQTSGHPTAVGAVGVAAVHQGTAGGAGGVFDGSESVETYSSDGPRQMFYAFDGTAYTPGVFTAPGGVLRQKPDLTAADCVDTSTPGFGVFCGTSAAAPHAAAIAGLLLERGFAPNAVLDAMKSTALDIEAPGTDRDSGVGIVDAFAAADALLPALGPVGTLLLVATLGLCGARSARRRR